MTTSFTIRRSPMNDDIHFSGTVSASDLITLRLDSFDRMLLDDCSRSNKSHDWLLLLEMIFRRLNEQDCTALREGKE